MDTYYIDGQFVDDEKAFVSAKDISILRGYGVFDFLITYNKRPFHLKNHVERLENSAKYIGLDLKHSNSQICDIVEKTVERNPHHHESSIRIVYTGGASSDGVTPEGKGILMVMVTPRHFLPEWWYKEGVKIITVDMERFMPDAKSTSYLSAIFAQRQAKNEGAVEAVYIDRNGRILECTTSNIFFFKGSCLITPEQDLLPGITRNVILNLAEKHFAVDIRDVGISELEGMDEAFITASSKEVVPVVKINNIAVGDSNVGKNTGEIMRLFNEYTKAYGEGTV